MAMKTSPRSEFFKLLMPGTFEKRLCIPPKFARRLAAERPPCGTATLQGPADGNFWHVRMHQDGPDEAFFGSGWPEFAAAHGLTAGHLVVFRYEGNMHFYVTVFDTSGCARENNDDDFAALNGNNSAGKRKRAEVASTPPSGTPEGRDPGSPLAGGEGAALKQPKKEAEEAEAAMPPRRRRKAPQPPPVFYGGIFERVVKPYHLKYLPLTKEYTRSIGLRGSCRVELSMAGEEELSWTVNFISYQSNDNLGNGWRKFADYHGIEEGDRILLRFLGDNRFLVRLVKRDHEDAADPASTS